MERIVVWWKREENRITLFKSCLLGFLPLLCCLVYCMIQGRGVGQVYLPASEWNDELFYYKQVESIVNYGFPQGYFGFNESHALKLSFAAWSPVLVFPWIIWGLMFGWNLMSPVICNIVLMMLCCFLFVWLVRPTWKQLGTVTVLFCLYTPFVRYMLSVMPEVICFSLLIIFYSLVINYQRREQTYKLVILFVLSGVMTLMRPYLLLFILLPCVLWIRKNRWRGIIGSGAVFAVVLGLYAVIKHYFGAEYFAPLFFTDWAEAFLEEGILEGIRFTLGKLYYMGIDFVNYTVRGVRTGLASGAFFAGFLVCMTVLVVQSVGDFLRWRKARKALAGAREAAGNVTEGKAKEVVEGMNEEAAESEAKVIQVRELGDWLLVEAHLAFSFVAMLFALLLMYKLTEGSKHLLTFVAAAVFVISLMDTKFFRKAAAVGVTFVYFYMIMAVDPYDYQVPFVREERLAEAEEWEKVLAEELVLNGETVPNFENVVIWTFSDTVDGKSINTQWQLLYALPKGFGISCCMPDYVMAHFEELQSKYICVVPGGEIEEKCIQAGYERIATAENAVMYRRY